jgi:hypothetical protein
MLVGVLAKQTIPAHFHSGHPRHVALIGLAVICCAVLGLFTAPGKNFLTVFRAPLQALPFRRLLLCAWLLLLIALILLRAPTLLINPRFWAEEGTVWFQYAVTHSPVDTLFYVFPGSGYYVLSTNVAAMLAAATKDIAGLRYAPMATTYCALVIQLVPFLIILCLKSHLFDCAWKVVAGCLIILFSPLATGEIWLNTINSMSYVGLSGFLLIFADTSDWTPRKVWIARSGLFLAGLSGLYAAVLFPLYAASYFVYRERERILQTAVLAACFCLQLGVVLLVKMNAGLAPQRFSFFTLDSGIVNIFYFEIVSSIVGQTNAAGMAKHLGLLRVLDISTTVPRPGTIWLAACLSFLLMAATAMALKGRCLASTKGLLIGGFIIYAAFTSLASLNGVPGGRYAFISGVIVLLLFMENIGTPQRHFLSVACGCLLIFALAQGILIYSAVPSGPSWSKEVTIWRTDPDYGLRVWPDWWTARIHGRP